MTTHKRITVMKGDGIGPEVVDSALRLLRAANAPLEFDEQLAGAEVFKAGDSTGVPEATVASIEANKIALKGPLETPVGYGERSANVSLRKRFETFANVRPAAHIPGTSSVFKSHPIDLVVIRENSEDLYSGIEHMQSADVAQTLKVMSRRGCENICRLAFEYAKSAGKSSVHCATKANIMKLTEGLMKSTFEAVSKDYPDITPHHIIIDNCAHQLVINPEQFEIIVTSNMNGDIISDLTSGLVGGLGVASSANIGRDYAIFEAVHGSAPTIAGQDKANPTAMIMSAVLMCRHLGLMDVAQSIENALFYTLESGFLTIDLASDPSQALGTKAFTDKIIEHLGKAPSGATSKPNFTPLVMPKEPTLSVGTEYKRDIMGLDLFLEAQCDAQTLGKHLESLTTGLSLKLDGIYNRGGKVYPSSGVFKDTINQWQCRFLKVSDDTLLSDGALTELLGIIQDHYRWNHIEKLLMIDGKPGYS